MYVLMGDKASKLFADVIMNCSVDKAMEYIGDKTPSLDKPFVCHRCIDDCFSIFRYKKSALEFEKIETAHIPTSFYNKKCNPTIA